MKIKSKKIVVIVLYWILYSIRCVLFAPVYFLCILMTVVVYMINLGFIYNAFCHRETYNTWRECREMVMESPGLCIPAFVVRHLYLSWSKINELYSEIKKS